MINKAQAVTALGMAPVTKPDEDWLELVVAAVNAYVNRVRPDLNPSRVRTSYELAAGAAVVRGENGTVTETNVSPPAAAIGEWPDDVTVGALQLFVRWYKRRGDVSANFDQFGSLPPADRDIEIMLGIGRAAGPVIA